LCRVGDCLQAAIGQIEQTLGLHPRRRTALVQARLTALVATVAERQLALAALRARPATPRTSARLTKLTQEVASMQAQQELLTAELAQLETDNVDVSSPLTVVIRLDAGFATDANLAWLIEMGYTVLTKAQGVHTTTRLQRDIAVDASWTPVGANAEALGLGAQRIGNGRYRLHALQVRYRLPEGWRHTTLLYYGDVAPPAPADWFRQYNGRQVVEAGIKENKGVFTMRRPPVRSPIEMQIHEQFALFAANLVRWAAAWRASNCARCLRRWRGN
jgi:hypothetical protein